LLIPGNSDERASNSTKVSIASSIATLKHIHDGANQTVAVLNQLALTSKVKCLKEEAKSCLDKDLVTVEAERETKLPLVKKLDNLDDVFASIANSHNGRRSLVAKIGDDNGAIDKCSDVVIYQRLAQSAK
jgi:hypothetical protein